jgi:transposase InsO family protein
VAKVSLPVTGARMSHRREPLDRERWARLRFAVIGPLLAAPPPPGQLQTALQELAVKTWQHPGTGLPLRFGRSTIERWYYAARRAQRDPVAALQTRVRCDVGQQRVLTPEVIAALRASYHAHPSWSCQLHYDNLGPTLGAAAPIPSYTTVRRYLQAQGWWRQPVRRGQRRPGEVAAAVHRQARETRSYEVDFVGGLWHLDFHHGSRPVLTRAGTWATPQALAVLDDRSRLACHVQWYLDETTESLVHGFSQALQRRGLPRALMSDNGAAMLAAEFTGGLHTLGIVHQTTLPYSPQQNGKQEVFWGRLEGRLMAMLEGVSELSLELLNTATHAWVEQEYQRTRHAELDTTPLARYLAGPQVLRECPDSAALRAAFRMEVTRTPRRSDGTVSLAGRRFELPARYRHLTRLHLRYARWDLSAVDLVDARRGTVLCALYPLDKSAHASGRRRAIAPGVSPAPLPPASGMAPLLRQLMAEYAATGLPPPFIPTAQEARS